MCKLGHCIEGCINHGDCLKDWVCRPIAANDHRCFKDCRSRQCPAGFTCTDGACIADVQLCAPCTDNAECGGPADRCLAEGDKGKFCAKDCTLSRECPIGFRCKEILEDIWQCIPAVGDCTNNCQIVGCPDLDYPYCNKSSGRCQDVLAPCDPCDRHESCGPGARCLVVNRDRYCIPTCVSNDAECPAGFRCDDRGDTPYCVPYSGTCDRCHGALCPPLAPYCSPENGACTECLSSSDCGQGYTCGDRSKLCIAAGPACPAEPGITCSDPNPFCYEGVCVQCLSNNDCPGQGSVCYHFSCFGDDFCQRINCPPDTTVCDADARACVEKGTCMRDEDCSGRRRCDVPHGVCYNADATCVTDAECPLTLTCDHERRLCRGCTGNGDCRVPFQQCVRLGDQSFCQQI
ncbi:MAG: hypothetical protein FJ125_10880 [Deltaproteobacteria bacterium]|nr:hypothetical protein [Deltaproteobacteria bacterium]